MSFDGHVLCQRMLMGPWALTTPGAATADADAAAAATLRKLRRVGRARFVDFDMAFLPRCIRDIFYSDCMCRMAHLSARVTGRAVTRALAVPEDI
jgi:hypothetical protein